MVAGISGYKTETQTNMGLIFPIGFVIFIVLVIAKSVFCWVNSNTPGHRTTRSVVITFS